MSKHTPGPWYTCLHASGTDKGFIRADSQQLALAKVFDYGTAPGSFEANARLIAAAPDLLDAVKWLARFCCLGDHDKNDPAIAKVWATLAKAEGKE